MREPEEREPIARERWWDDATFGEYVVVLHLFGGLGAVVVNSLSGAVPGGACFCIAPLLAPVGVVTGSLGLVNKNETQARRRRHGIALCLNLVIVILLWSGAFDR